MITQTFPSLFRSRFAQILGATVALTLVSATASIAALSKGDNYIEQALHLAHPDATLTVSTSTIDPAFIRDAAIAAILALPPSSTDLPSVILISAVARVPQFAGEIGEAALKRVYSVGTAPGGAVLVPMTILGTDAKKATQVALITTNSVAKGLADYIKSSTGVLKLKNQNPFQGAGRTPGTTKADAAAYIALNLVRIVKDQSNLSTTSTTALTPLQNVIKAAVVAAAKIGDAGQTGGAPGVVAGAIAIGAGANNANIASANSTIVRSILKTAATAAPTKALQIAEAAGYAFASTYINTRDTSSASTYVDVKAFVAANTAGISGAIKSGLTAANQLKLNLQITEQINSGIAKAYAGLDDSGSAGVIFVGGVPTGVTPN